MSGNRSPNRKRADGRRLAPRARDLCACNRKVLRCNIKVLRLIRALAPFPLE